MRSPRRPKGRALSSHPRTTPHNAPFSNPQVAYRPLLAAASFNPQRLELDIGAFVRPIDLRSRWIAKQDALGQPSAVVLRPITTTLKFPKVWLECQVGGIIDRQPLIHTRQRHWRAPTRERVA